MAADWWLPNTEGGEIKTEIEIEVVDSITIEWPDHSECGDEGFE